MVKVNPFLKFQSRDLLVWVFTVLLCLGFLLAFLRKIINPDPETEAIVFSVLFYLLLVWWIYRKAKQTGIGVLGFVRGGEPVKKLQLAGLVFLLLAFSTGAPLLTGYLLSYIAPSVLEWDWWYQSYDPESSLYPAFNYSLYVLFALIFAPVVEEFVFRGFLLNRWATKWGTRTSILATSAAFVIQYKSILFSFVLAICMAILYLKSRSLLAPILAHFLYNTVAIAWWFLPRKETQSGITVVEYYRSSIWLGLFWVMISLPVLLAYIYRNWPQKNDMPPHSEVDDQKSFEHTVNNASY